MKIFLTGATGLIGRAVLLRLRRDGHEVRGYTRSTAAAPFGTEALAIRAGGVAELRSDIEGCDAVINLAGEPVIARRWNASVREGLAASRVGLAYQISDAIAGCRVKPRVLVNASAVGFYGDRGDERVDENSPGGTGFLAGLCRDWEQAAQSNERHGLRVAMLRIGVVLARSSGALAKMLPPFKAGIGGPIGTGRQYFPWIHIDDMVEIVVHALKSEKIRGPVNCCAPQELTNAEFSRALGRAVGKPAVLPVPSMLLRAGFGDAADALLTGQRVVPARLQELGYAWKFPMVDAALADVLDESAASIRHAGEGPAPSIGGTSAYLTHRPPAFLLRTRLALPAPRGEVFAFASRAENLALLTPPSVKMKSHGFPAAMGKGAKVDYTLNVGPAPINKFPIKWRTHIEAWQPGRMFADSQTFGPYACWWHEHHFDDWHDAGDAPGTVMEDRVYYAPPCGGLGELAHPLLIAPQLRELFNYRAHAIRLRFGNDGRQCSKTA